MSRLYFCLILLLHKKISINRVYFSFNSLPFQELKTFASIIINGGYKGRVLLTCKVGKPIATIKLAHQLMRTATDIAAGRGPWENNSAVIIQGIEPGPTAKKTT